MKASPAKWVAKTALFLAILIVFQAVTAPLGMTLVTGSLVNLTLIITVMLGGLSSGVTVAILSPVLASILGIGPKVLPLLPCIMIGNVVLVLIWHYLTAKLNLPQLATYILATIVAAGLKFIVLYLLIVKLLVQNILAVAPPQSTILTAMFSAPQLITALIGGIIATVLLPILRPLMNSTKLS
ncbi:ECF transporter S component [Agrilactobacillus yilanensis]|uniref:ECF transporter S component n=1 Tax=Agrilactobacillus yilanensis TaxID=2485997 RepID=A0ABW4J6L5_9LACO|nr:ECF transporter S component [Agrilactobacillus yilanensis]